MLSLYGVFRTIVLNVVSVQAGAAVNENLSLLEVALVPPAVVTLISTCPAAWAGDVTVIVVGPTTEKLAELPPNDTRVVPVKFVPVSVTDVPPAAAPEVGDTPVTVGSVPPGAVKVKWSLLEVALVPLGVVTVTSTCPAA